MTYVFSPLFQKISPKRVPTTMVKKSRMALYGGFLQYDQCCFQKQALN